MRKSLPRPSINYHEGKGEYPSDYETLYDKLHKAIEIIDEALSTYENPVILWTGGKDSTLLTYLTIETANHMGHETPPALFINHFLHFDNTPEFVQRWADRWDIQLYTVSNKQFLQHAEANNIQPGDDVLVEDLPADLQEEVTTVLNYNNHSFTFQMSNLPANHLLKTVPLNNAIAEYNHDGVISGIRWSEDPSRSTETFFSSRHNTASQPKHDRVHPILPLTEEDLWKATWNVMVPEVHHNVESERIPPVSVEKLGDNVQIEDIPVNSRYFNGYRSIGGELSTDPTEEGTPAWEQDLDNTEERGGRSEDKQELLEHLRQLGYM